MRMHDTCESPGSSGDGVGPPLPVLLVRWQFAVPLLLVLIVAQNRGWVFAMNVLLGSDVVGSARRRMAIGFNEALSG
ncbi:hypothetical protein [Blastococcus sp. SYSU DS0539]